MGKKVEEKRGGNKRKGTEGKKKKQLGKEKTPNIS